MNKPVSAEDNVWYRQFYVWLIIFLPACAVTASFVTLYIAAQNPPEMAVADYASIEAFAEEQIARDRRAAELGLHAELTFSDGKVSALLDSNNPTALPAIIGLRIQHSTTARFDTNVNLAGKDGVYTGSISLPSGAYDIHLEAPDLSWRLSTRASGNMTEVAIAAFKVAGE